MKRIFDGFDPSQYETETERRWGHTEAYAISAKRTRGYTPEDWKVQAAEQADIYADAYRELQAGKPPGDAAVLAIAERHRSAIERWFYPCSRAHHARLADMYLQDPRFSDSIDRFGPALTPFLVAAIRANARRPHD